MVSAHLLMVDIVESVLYSEVECTVRDILLGNMDRITYLSKRAVLYLDVEMVFTLKN